jgi:hypothetical protein
VIVIQFLGVIASVLLFAVGLGLVVEEILYRQETRS